MPCRYFAKVIKVDTKLYGLPHTRERKYLLAWKEGVYGALGEFEVGDAWEEMVKGLQSTHLAFELAARVRVRVRVPTCSNSTRDPCQQTGSC